MFSIDKITALITNEQIQFAPWPYLVVEKMINNDTALIIHNRLKTGVNWELDSRVSSNIWLDKDVDKEIKMIFEPLTRYEFLANLIKRFNMTLPKEFDSTWSFAWHRKGAKQIPHNDMHVIDNINRKCGENFNRMFTQQIYFPETKCYADNECNCEESGIWLSESKKKRVTQIKCNPGTYFCYPNSEQTWHEVPEQKYDFDRISAISRTLWNE
tara:strand:+ start:774 stop:1412 length:639 start_codon:yes stop_codon:yes gene_type:complete